MRYKQLLFVFFINSVTFLPARQLQAQVSAGELKLLHKLDSISASPNVSAYFADLYFVTMVNAIRFFENAHDTSRNEIRLMQAGFAQYFFAAADSFAQQKNSPSSWKNYYEDTSSSTLRHVLLGINAHINGDIWQVLAGSFSIEKLKEIKPLYYSYYRGLLDIYEQVYEAARDNSGTLRILHAASLGLDKWYGKKLLHRWLKRQMKLACLYHRDPGHFRKSLARLQRKMARLDKAIIRHF